MLFLQKKISNFEFYFDCKGISKPPDRLGVSLIGRLVVELGVISGVGIFPAARAV
jgi:hypothetical protein